MNDDSRDIPDMTEAERDERLRAFFERTYLQPLADQRRADANSILRCATDPAAASYFVPRRNNGPYVHQLPSPRLAEQLTAIVAAGPLPELAAAVPALLALADAIHAQDDEPGDVSPFVYAMF